MEKVGDCTDDNNYSAYNGIIGRDFCVGLLGFASDLKMIKHVGISSRKMLVYAYSEIQPIELL